MLTNFDYDSDSESSVVLSETKQFYSLFDYDIYSDLDCSIQSNQPFVSNELRNFMYEFNKLLENKNPNIYYLVISLAWLIRVTEAPNESSTSNYKNFYSIISALWESVSNYYAPALSQAGLLRLLTTREYGMGRGLYVPTLHDILGRYKLESAGLLNERHLIIKAANVPYIYTHSAIEAFLQQNKNEIQISPILPDPSTLTPDTVVISFKLPATMADIGSIIAAADFNELLHYTTHYQIGLEIISTSFFNLRDKNQWEQKKLNSTQEATPSSSHAMINASTQESKDKLVTMLSRAEYDINDNEVRSLIDSKYSRKALIAGINHLNQPNTNMNAKGQVFTPKSNARSFYGVQFNHNNNLLLVCPGGKGSGIAILLEKNASGEIDVMLFHVDRYSNGDLNDILPFDYNTFNFAATLTTVPNYLVDPMSLSTMHNTRLLLSLAMGGKLDAHQSLINALKQAPDSFMPEYDIAAHEEVSAPATSQPELTFSGCSQENLIDYSEPLASSSSQPNYPVSSSSASFFSPFKRFFSSLFDDSSHPSQESSNNFKN